MLHLILEIANPWAKESFDSVFERSGTISKNKFWEFQIYRYNQTLACVSLIFNPRRKDHGGLEMEIGIFKYTINFKIIDSRHWDYTNDCWEKHE